MVDAYPREPMVDLDRPAPQRPVRDPGTRLRVGWQRLRTARLQVGAVALAAVVGALAGGVAVHQWEARQRRAAEAATVTVSAQLLDPRDLSSIGTQGTSSVLANLTLVNLGPLPILVMDLDGSRDGLAFRNAGVNATVRPGFRTLTVRVTFACARRTISSDPMPLHMRVRTGDGRTRTVDTLIEIGAARWPSLLEQTCQPTGSG